MDLLLLGQLFRAARRYVRNTSVDASFVVIIALVGALILISVVITCLVWLRYLVITGLITTSAVTAIRWKRGDISGLGHFAVEIGDRDGPTVPEPNLEPLGVYIPWAEEETPERSQIDGSAEGGEGFRVCEPGLEVPGID